MMLNPHQNYVKLLVGPKSFCGSCNSSSRVVVLVGLLICLIFAMDTKLHFQPNLDSVPVHAKPVQASSNLSSFSYCGSYHAFTPLWINEGLSMCFFSTLCTGLFFLIFIMVVHQALKIRRHGVVVESKYQPQSIWFYVQVLGMLLLLVETPIYFGIEWGLVNKETSGANLLYFITRLLLLSASFHLLLTERKTVFWTVQIKGHSNALLLTWAILFLAELLSTVSWDGDQWWFLQQTKGEQILFGFWVARVVCTSPLFLIGFFAPGVPKLNYWLLVNEDEDRDLESSQEENGMSNDSTARNRSTWSGLKEKLHLLWPYMWPAGNPLLQMRVLMCIACLVAGRVVNPFVPIYYKYITNSLTDKEGVKWSVVWVQVIAYVGLKCLQGSGFSGGILNGIRSFLWIRVQQYTNRLVQIKLFAHLHSLSLRWHLSRKTGEVLRSIDRGTTSINSLLSYVVFSIAPTICDIIIAIVYFVTAFNVWFGLIVFVCLVLYLATTIIITEWRTKYRRDMNTKDNRAKQKAIDSLLNFETVKYYNAEEYEVKRYDEAILDYQDSEYLTTASLVFLNFAQNIVINLGLLAGSLLCVHYVLIGVLDLGDFVLFGAYIVQLYTPLGFFGTYYRMIQTAFIDMENMFELFDEGHEVTDKEDAVKFSIKAGTVEFKNVCFHYSPQKEILKNISFRVDPGQTYALVGPSGSGKSTIIRLLFRFYDVQSGVVELDGVDISTITQRSLRACIGVVPQDTVLFNDNILNNIRYGRINATDEEVKEAAVSADIHHRIVNMPDHYETMVGERGLKLSGGEKQRVAIARTMLKAPSVVLLDEATSALDTNTERNIQASLARVSAGKTSIVVAHRLSTIVNADCILVIKDGEIMERGRHDQLLQMEDGIYSQMWQQQLTEFDSLEEEDEKKEKTK